jgi:recombination protein RecA
VRIDVRRAEVLKNGADVYGSHTKCKVVKNKVAPPFKTAEFDILYGSGISKSSEIIDMAIQLEIVEKSGAWFYYDGERLGQGKENVRKLIESDKELMDKLETLVREKVKNTPIDDDAVLSDDDFDIKDFDDGDI